MTVEREGSTPDPRDNEDLEEQNENKIVKTKDGDKIEVEVEDDPNDEEYGQKVQRRIKKETAKRRQAERLARDYENRLRDYENRINNTSRQVDFSDYEKLRSQQQQVATTLTAAQNQLRLARQYNDIEREIEAQNAIAACHADMKNLNVYKHVNTHRFNQFEGGQAQQYIEPTRQQQAQPRLHAETNKWVRRNTWFDPKSDSFDQQMYQEAMAINEDMENEGYDNSAPEFYRELDRRLKDEFPNKSRSSRSSPVSAPSRGSAPASKVRLTPFQVEFARKNKIPLERMAVEAQNVARKG